MDTTYIIVMQNRNLITSIRGDKEQIRHIVMVLLELDWYVTRVYRHNRRLS